MNKKIRVIISLISCLVICIFGLYRIVGDYPNSTTLLIPIILIIGGFIGFIGNIIELKKMNNS